MLLTGQVHVVFFDITAGMRKNGYFTTNYRAEEEQFNVVKKFIKESSSMGSAESI